MAWIAAQFKFTTVTLCGIEPGEDSFRTANRVSVGQTRSFQLHLLSSSEAEHRSLWQIGPGVGLVEFLLFFSLPNVSITIELNSTEQGQGRVRMRNINLMMSENRLPTFLFPFARIHHPQKMLFKKIRQRSLVNCNSLQCVWRRLCIVKLSACVILRPRYACYTQNDSSLNVSYDVVTKGRSFSGNSDNEICTKDAKNASSKASVAFLFSQASLSLSSVQPMSIYLHVVDRRLQDQDFLTFLFSLFLNVVIHWQTNTYGKFAASFNPRHWKREGAICFRLCLTLVHFVCSSVACHL